MSDAIKKLHDYLAMSPSVVYPEDVLAYLPAIEDENAKLRLQIHWLKKGDVYAYEAGYHDGATNYELDHCPSCKNIADLQDALDENAKLRDENSRLQKYASKALSAISYCDCCPYVDCGCDTETVPMHEGCKAFEELSELGVVVE